MGNRFLYNRIPKAANSTVMVNLAAHAFGVDAHADAARRMFRRPSELSRAEADDFDALFGFTFVRDPFVRARSAYLDKVARKAGESGTRRSFEAFLESLRSGALHDNSHWALQRSLFLIPSRTSSSSGAWSRSTASSLYTLERLWPNRERPAAQRFTWHRTGAREKLATYYAPRAEDLVRSLYAEDFVTFGYSDRLDD